MPNMAHYDIVTLHNIMDKDFTFEYDRSGGNPPYVIPAGKIKRYPRFIAAHALKHLVDEILTSQGKRTSDQTARQGLIEKIVIEEEKFQEQPKKSEAQKQREEIDRLNVPSELDAILAKRRGKVKEAEAEVEEKPEEKEEFAGLKPHPDDVGPEVDATDKDVPIEKVVKPMPTRNEIYQYAANSLKMVIDEETKKKFDKMKVKELLKAVGDPREDLK